MSKKQGELKKQILYILSQFPKSRDSDQWLTIKLWCVFYPKKIKTDSNEEKYVYLGDIMDLPREDSIKRLRAKIQNEEHKFLPLSWVVAKKREINEVEWRKAMITLKQSELPILEAC